LRCNKSPSKEENWADNNTNNNNSYLSKIIIIIIIAETSMKDGIKIIYSDNKKDKKYCLACGPLTKKLTITLLTNLYILK
jgi:hypothetical protein